MSHEHHHHDEKHAAVHCAVHVGLKVARVLLQAATVAAGFCVVKELHRVHKAIESHKK